MPGKSKDADGPKTEAMKNFEANLDPLRTFIEQLGADASRRCADALNAAERIKSAVAQLPAVIGQSQGLKEARAEVEKVIAEIEKTKEFLTETRRTRTEFITFAYNWMCVMLVTFLEAYLEDGLISLAERNPALLEKGPQVPSIRILQCESIEALRAEARQIWAQHVLREAGGPKTWVKNLQRMGARGFDPKACRQVQFLWDTRNIIVHSRGIASAPYAREYAAEAITAGAKVPVGAERISYWLGALTSFQKTTETFFQKYKS